MRLLLDNDVPVSVADVFTAHGHDVLRLDAIIPADSKDDLVEAVAAIEGRILVAKDKGHRRKMFRKLPKGGRRMLRNLSLIELNCYEPDAAKRVKEAMSFLEHEHKYAESTGKRMVVVIRDEVMRTHR